MSQANVEIVRRGWEHFLATGQMLEEIVAQDFAWDMSTFRGWPEQQVYVGAEGTRAFLGDWTGAFDDWTIELQALHDGGEKVVSVCRQRGRSRATGMPVEMLFGMVWTLHDGMQTRMEMYADPAEALEAAGLAQSA
jgi:ketosteroid isomerase-like protein